MSTFVLIPGAGGSSWYWHRVVPLLEARGYDVVAPDLPATDETARLPDYVDAALAAVGSRTGLVVVGQSLGGLVAPIVAAEREARLLVLVAPMIPTPGETGGQWWSATGQDSAAAAFALAEGRDPDALSDPVETFLHDLPTDVRDEALERPAEQNAGPFLDPWPLSAWPTTPTRVVAGRHDRLFPIEFMQRLARERLGIDPDIVDTGHLPALADPTALVTQLVGYLDDPTLR